MNLRAIGLVSGALLSGLAAEATLLAQEPPKAEAPRAAEAWIRDLGADSYKQRLAAERALRELGEDALPALKKAAEDSDDAEVQWRSKRLIRQIERGDTAVGGAIEEREPRDGWRRDREPRQWRGGLPDARDQFEDMFRRLERDFGIDIPRSRFFRDDFFRDLDQQFRDLRGLQGRLQGMSRGMSMQVGPDGVRVEVEEKNEKGETERKVYEAPDMETFREQYPDVLKKHGLMLGDGKSPFGFRNFGGDLQLPGFEIPQIEIQPFDFDTSPPNWQLTPPAPPADGERLGVFIRDEVPPQVREYLNLDAGVGLMIESVQDGTIAADLGLERGDIVTAIGGSAIGSAADVRAALAEIEAGSRVEVTWIRRGVEKTGAVVKPKPRANQDGGKKERRVELKKSSKTGDKIR